MQKQKATPKNDGIQKCPTCGAGMKPLFLQTSFYCPNNCDLKDRGQAVAQAAPVTWYLVSNDHGDYQPGQVVGDAPIRQTDQTSSPYVYEVVPTIPPVKFTPSKDGVARWKASVKIVKKIKG